MAEPWGAGGLTAPSAERAHRRSHAGMTDRPGLSTLVVMSTLPDAAARKRARARAEVGLYREGQSRRRRARRRRGPTRAPSARHLLTERAFQLRALAESSDVESARAVLRNYFKGGTITMTPEPFEDGHAYVARAEFLPPVLLTDKAATPCELEPGGRCPRRVARGAMRAVYRGSLGFERGLVA